MEAGRPTLNCILTAASSAPLRSSHFPLGLTVVTLAVILSPALKHQPEAEWVWSLGATGWLGCKSEAAVQPKPCTLIEQGPREGGRSQVAWPF